MAAKPSRSHWPTVSPRDKMCPTLTCTWSHDERGTDSGGERPVNSRIERRWTPSPLNSGLLWASLNRLAEQESDATVNLMVQSGTLGDFHWVEIPWERHDIPSVVHHLARAIIGLTAVNVSWDRAA